MADGIGEPVNSFTKPDVGAKYPVVNSLDNDDLMVMKPVFSGSGMPIPR